MNRQEIVEDIKFIKDVITSSTQYTNLSGLGAILSGVAALIGCAISFFVLNKNTENLKKFEISYELVGVWTGVFIFSVIANAYFTMHKARKTGQPAWSRLSKLILYALGPALLVGAALTFFLLAKKNTLWIPSIWMTCYGLGVWSAALFSIKEARYLGAFFMVTGLVVLFWFLDYSLLALAISFGGYHILYGFWLIYKYGS